MRQRLRSHRSKGNRAIALPLPSSLFLLLAGVILVAAVGCDGEAPEGALQPSSSSVSESNEESVLFYLHGRIIETQGLPAVSPRFGEYRYGEILKTFEDKGFVVKSEARAAGTDPEAYARLIVEEIEELLETTNPERITVLGASVGAFIAATVSHLAENGRLNFVLLATCHPETLSYQIENGRTLHGRVLAIYEASDEEFSGSCEPLFEASVGRGLVAHEELRLETGLGHGVLFRPLPEWVEPTVLWAQRGAGAPAVR